MLRAASIQRSLRSSLSSSIAGEEFVRSRLAPLPLLLSRNFFGGRFPFLGGRSPDDFPRYEPAPLPKNWGLCIVPPKEVYVVERFGQYFQTLKYGIHFLVPLVDHIAYVHALKEKLIHFPQSAFTKDKVDIRINGILFIKVVDPIRASYEVENPIDAIIQLARTTLRSHLVKMTLLEILVEMNAADKNIVKSINEAASDWGLQCIRLQIRDISAPPGVKEAMEIEVVAEITSRTQLLKLERERQAQIQVDEKKKITVILASQAKMMARVYRAHGEAEAVHAKMKAATEGLHSLLSVIPKNEGSEAPRIKMICFFGGSFYSVAYVGGAVSKWLSKLSTSCKALICNKI
ncbi:hypothetical protein J5N97_025454 [Dioscorea zingiberensis]|uniref:Band 7 domain-containing protein n=1 Tax=Dioscorea zingiberensis TaxID=325984 RepID=A0A9D5H9V0_9LILI|nr:hypothetical protein J5N97_025454 [Dioscorea zingiberensis]